jgi:molecular chaperone HscB
MENYFSTFAIDAKFEIDLAELNRQYRALAVNFHPDKFVNGEASEQRIAVQKSTQLNEAYKTLKNPVTRAAYLLNKLLEPVGEQFVMEQYHVTDTELLMQQIDYREQLAAISDSQDIDALSKFQLRVKAIAKQTQQTINADFDALLNQSEQPQKSETPDISETLVVDLKNQICELRFLEKLAHDCDELEEQLLEL